MFDLYQTASNAALTALGKDPLATQSIKLEAFNAAGHDRADFVDWEGTFVDRLQMFQTLKNRPSKAAQASIAAAAAAKTPSGVATAAGAAETNTTSTN